MDRPIPSKMDRELPSKCKLCTMYGVASRTHDSKECKKWLTGRKAHPEWNDKAKNINVHQENSVNKLMV